jgi:PAS domain S-box-containing protein
MAPAHRAISRLWSILCCRNNWLVALSSLGLLILAHGTALLFRVHPAVSLWFPPAGVAITLTLWLGPIGALFTGIASVIMAPYWGSHGWMRLVGLLDAIEPLLAWWFYRHAFKGSLMLDSLKDAIAFLISVPLIACMTSAVVGSSLLMTLGVLPSGELQSNVEHWWLGNALGTIAIVPLALVVCIPYLQQWNWLRSNSDKKGPEISVLFMSYRYWSEVILILASVIIAASLTVHATQVSMFATVQFSLLSFIPVFWAVTRFGIKGGVLTASFSIFITLANYVLIYPSAMTLPQFPVNAELLHTHKLSLLLQGITGLLIGTAVTEQFRTQTALAVEQVRFAEYQTRARLSEKLLQLNRRLTEASQQVLESEERFRASVENMLDCFGIYSAVRDACGQITDFRIEYVNQATCFYNQLSLEEQIGYNLCELLPEQQTSGLFDEYCQVVETGKPLVKDSFLYGGRTKQRPFVKAFDIRITKFGDGFVSIWRDVSDRHYAAEELHRRKQEFTALVEHSPDVISRFDRDLKHVYISPAIESITGMPAIQFIGKSIAEMAMPIPKVTAWQTALETVFATGESHLFEFEFASPQQDTKFYQTRLTPEFNQDGSVASILAVTRDITELKKTEEGLRQSESHYRYLAESIPQLVWITDATGSNEYVNQQFCNYTGLSFADLMGLGWYVAVHPNDIEAVERSWLMAVHQCTPYECEYRLKRVDGIYRWFLARSIPVTDEQGQVVKWFGTNTEIQSQKDLETVRTQLLSQEQAARLQAESASRMKDEFLAVVSHELRSPLNAILGWAKLLRTHSMDEATTNKALEVIERNARAQTQLIEDLLDISRIIRGAIRLHPRPLHLAQVVEAALDTLTPVALTKHISLTSELDSTLWVFGDFDRLQQVVWNLLSNAVKFTPEGGQVKVSLTMSDRAPALTLDQTNGPINPNCWATITVTDTGKGIEAEFLPYVFDQFRQADSTISRAQGGLGLGLAIVRNLVELHGGTVEVDSAGAGQGSAFTVRLPIVIPDQALETHNSAGSHHSLPLAWPLALAQMRVLVVDDNVDTRDFVNTVLSQVGMTVMLASSALEALQLIQQQKPDILLSDISMPVTDGYELIRRVRSLPPDQGGAIPAAALTAYVREDDRLQAIAAGFHLHVPKPIDAANLLNVVVQLAMRIR